MKYFKVNTIGDGYHTNTPVEMEIDSFYINLALAFERLTFISVNYKPEGAWFQFDLNEDDGDGIGFFYEL